MPLIEVVCIIKRIMPIYISPLNARTIFQENWNSEGTLEGALRHPIKGSSSDRSLTSLIHHEDFRGSPPAGESCLCRRWRPSLPLHGAPPVWTLESPFLPVVSFASRTPFVWQPFCRERPGREKERKQKINLISIETRFRLDYGVNIRLRVHLGAYFRSTSM